MDADALHEFTAARSHELPGTELTHPFGPDTDVYRVREKMFMLHTRLGGVPIVNLKARPDDVRALIEGYAEITPGWHMNKRHWITLRPGLGLSEELVEDLVTESYLLVVDGLPRARRPVDPDAFARTMR